LKSDLDFISGDFFDIEMPRSKKYLFKYFRTNIQKQFVRYYHVFNSARRFPEHTGWHCEKRWLQLLVVRLNLLERTLKKARAEMDFNTVTLIESGKFKFARFGRGEYDDYKSEEI
jgi:hypothetical protein